jgi:O-acetylhomoserine/O-acetylserine sulfhydrylase-like pyridoxal-dependent enzyme
MFSRDTVLASRETQLEYPCFGVVVARAASGIVSQYANRPDLRWVNYPGLPDHPYHGVAVKQFRKDHFGGVLSFGVKGDSSRGAKVVDSLKLASNLANVGDAKTVSTLDGHYADTFSS